MELHHRFYRAMTPSYLSPNPYPSGSESEDFSGVEIEPALGVSYLWSAGPLRIGPTVDVGLTWQQMNASVTGYDDEKTRNASALFKIGADARLTISNRLSLYLGLFLSAHTTSKVFESQEATSWASGYLDFSTSLGLLFFSKNDAPTGKVRASSRNELVYGESHQ